MNIVEKRVVVDEDEMRGALSLEIDGEVAFSVRDGEAEDRLLFRDFRDCYRISDLLKAAYEAGKAGESFNVEVVEETEEY